MKSSSGEYYVALDHVRALAAFLVFSWHFLNVTAHGTPISPVIYPPILADGSTGVALFMTLSGYLFAKIINGRDINYFSFLYNRALRLVPLLAIVVAIAGVKYVAGGGSVLTYARSILSGLVYPSLPNGGWSITVEAHFYIVLPVLLFLLRTRRKWLFAIISFFIMIRLAMYFDGATVRDYAYWTIIGRIDQFLLGMLAFDYRDRIKGRHGLFIGTVSAFALAYWYYGISGSYFRAPDEWWIFLTTIEGIAYGIGIAWYDNSFEHSTSRFSRFLGHIGTYSYSIYLLHFFFVFRVARALHKKVLDLSFMYTALAVSVFVFLLMVPIGYLSFTYIEKPLMRWRVPYIRGKSRAETRPVAGQEASPSLQSG